MSDIRILHKKLLEIAVYFDEFCSKHNIKYYLGAGTALGAIRHKGFIPWDDDFDVFMLYEDYKRFMECADKFLDKENYYLQKENTKEWPLFFSKLRKNNTTFIEETTKDREMHKGIFIDIFCYRYISDNSIIYFFQYLAARLLGIKALNDLGHVPGNRFRRMVSNFLSFFIRGFIKTTLIKIVNSSKNTKRIGYLFSRPKPIKLIFPSDIVGKARYFDFEGQKFPVFEKVEEYLEMKYGKDYMKIPDKYAIKKEYPVHAIYWNTEKDFTEYPKLISKEER